MRQWQNGVARLTQWANCAPRGVTVGLLALLWVVAYFPANHFAAPVRYLVPTIGGEVGWPLVDWTVLIYLSAVVQMLFSLVWLKTAYGRAWVAAVFLIIFHGVIFWLYPTVYPRTYEVSSLQQPWQTIYAAIGAVDAPHNCWPSLHVSLPLLVALVVTTVNRRRGLLLTLWAGLIAVSIVTTKQHYVADALGGIVTAVLAAIIIAPPGFSPAGRSSVAAEEDITTPRVSRSVPKESQ